MTPSPVGHRTGSGNFFGCVGTTKSSVSYHCCTCWNFGADPTGGFGLLKCLVIGYNCAPFTFLKCLLLITVRCICYCISCLVQLKSPDTNLSGRCSFGFLEQIWTSLYIYRKFTFFRIGPCFHLQRRSACQKTFFFILSNAQNVFNDLSVIRSCIVG
uniref:Uncharacterized protein n=1 Tax=Pyxicephalus adspersus TaxID=30357 RepID=A0AAV2ZMN6_PYXAD|nr:TPA: hypothetical protein GDO54_002319 [Pyxicephalus adspersus]